MSAGVTLFVGPAIVGLRRARACAAAVAARSRPLRLAELMPSALLLRIPEALPQTARIPRCSEALPTARCPRGRRVNAACAAGALHVRRHAVRRPQRIKPGSAANPLPRVEELPARHRGQARIRHGLPVRELETAAIRRHRHAPME